MRTIRLFRTAPVIAMAVLCSVAAVPAQPLELRATVNLTPRTAVATVGNYSYAVGNNSFVVINHTTADHPAIAGQTAPGVPGLVSVDVAAGYAYCAGGAVGLVILDATAQSPQWITSFGLAGSARDADVYQDLCAVATAANVSLVRVSDPAHPAVVATYGRAANWLEFSGSDQRIFVGSQTGAFVLQVQREISGGDTTWALTLDDEYGSSPISTLDQNGSFVNLARGADLLALRTGDFALAGSYSASSSIRAVKSVGPICFVGLALGSVQYLDQRGNTPIFVTSAGLPTPATGLASGSSSSGPVVVAAHNSGVSILSYTSLAAEEPREPFLPEAYTLRPFPNPFNGAVSLQISVGAPGNYELLITNPVGQTILSEQLFLSGPTTKRLNLTRSGAGIYFATLRAEHGASAAVKLLYLP